MPDLTLDSSCHPLLREATRASGSLRSTVDGNEVLLSTARLDDFAKWVQFQLSPDSFHPAMPDALAHRLAGSSRAFHCEAGTDSFAIRNAIDRLERGAPIIEIAYQPNTLAGYNVVSQALVAQLATPPPAVVGNPYEPVILFRMLDYDEAGDLGLRSAVVPDVNRSTPLRLSGAVRSGDRRKIAMAAPSPSNTMMDDWLRRLKLSAVESARRLNKLRVPDTPIDVSATRENADRMGEMVRSAYTADRSITTANAIVMSQLVNNVWGMQNVVFAPASSLLSHHLTVWPMVGLSRESPNNHESFGLWRVCDSCFHRVPTKVTFGREFGGATSESACCGREHAEAIDPSSIQGPFGDIPKFIPRVGLCDFLDQTQFGFSATVSYAGGIEHVKRSREAAFRRNGRLQPDFLYDPQAMLTTKRLQDVLPTSMADAFNRGKFPALLFSTWVPDMKVAQVVMAKAKADTRGLPALLS